MIKKIILAALAVICLKSIAHAENIDYAYLDATLNFVDYIPNIADVNTNMVIYFKDTETALFIMDGNVTIRSNTIKEIKSKDVERIMYSDALFVNNMDNLIVIK